jgi:hypothetical protein
VVALRCSLDHEGAIESEDAFVFQLAAIRICRFILKNLGTEIPQSEWHDMSPVSVCEGLEAVGGLIRCIISADSLGIAVWHDGSGASRPDLLAPYMHAVKSSPSLPHESRLASEFETMRKFAFKSLLATTNDSLKLLEKQNPSMVKVIAELRALVERLRVVVRRPMPG